MMKISHITILTTDKVLQTTLCIFPSQSDMKALQPSTIVEGLIFMLKYLLGLQEGGVFMFLFVFNNIISKETGEREKEKHTVNAEP